MQIWKLEIAQVEFWSKIFVMDGKIRFRNVFYTALCTCQK